MIKYNKKNQEQYSYATGKKEDSRSFKKEMKNKKTNCLYLSID